MKTGWIFQIKGKPGMYRNGYDIATSFSPPYKQSTIRLRNALVVSTRSLARLVKADNETILRVLLNRKGEPIKILSRG